jgi:Flp pilus assembly protein CpaB
VVDVAVAPERTVASAPAAGALRRRSPLPTGRAVLGGFLVALSAVGIFAGYSRAAAGPTTEFVVARHDLPVGTRLVADDLALMTMDLPPEMRRRAAFRHPEAVVGSTTVGPVRAGELVQAGALVQKRSGAGELEVSFAIDSSRALGGRLRAGDQVDVLATFGGGGQSYTVAVVRQARILEASGGGSGLRDGDSETITLVLGTSAEALAVSHAVNVGEVTLVRSTGTTASGPVGETYEAPPIARADGGA